MIQYIGLIAAALAILGYVFFQSTPVDFHLKKFIAQEPTLVFKLLKDPQYLTDLHPKVRNVFLESFQVDANTIERRHFIIQEDIPHVGIQNVSVVSVSDPNDLSVHTEAVILHGLVHVNMTYRLTKTWSGAVAGTMVDEMTTMHFPYIMKDFSNRTAVEAHTQILNNLEVLAEFTAASESHEDVIIDGAS